MHPDKAPLMAPPIPRNRAERRAAGLYGLRSHPQVRTAGRPFRRAFAGIANTLTRQSLAKAVAR